MIYAIPIIGIVLFIGVMGYLIFIKPAREMKDEYDPYDDGVGQ